MKGADLSDDKKEEMIQIEIELTQLTDKYRSNIHNSINDLELFVKDDKELEGLPNSTNKQASELAEKRGHVSEFLFTLQNASIRSIMKYSKSEKLRKKMWESQCMIGHKGEFDNEQIIIQILSLRN